MQRIGPYNISAEIGRGGMGSVVYRAMQPSLNRVVALKVLPEHLEKDRETVDRFRMEGQVAASLDHPNIVKVWEASLDTAPYYIAMEILPNGTLEQRLAAGTVSTAEALRILAQISHALDYAQHRQIVHRDVKPANIMFHADGRAVLMDFGIVRDNRHGRMTVDGSKLLTPYYASPEQAKGLENLDSRSDQYSLAAMFYEMVVGHPPFTGEPYAVMGMIVNETPPPPSQARPGLPKALDAVFAKALAKRPEMRFRSAGEFSAAVRKVLPADFKVPERIAKPVGSRFIKRPKPSPDSPTPVPPVPAGALVVPAPVGPTRIIRPQPQPKPVAETRRRTKPERAKPSAGHRLPTAPALRRVVMMAAVVAAVAGGGYAALQKLSKPDEPPGLSPPGMSRPEVPKTSGPTQPPQATSSAAPTTPPVGDLHGKTWSQAKGQLQTANVKWYFVGEQLEADAAIVDGQKGPYQTDGGWVVQIQLRPVPVGTPGPGETTKPRRTVSEPEPSKSEPKPKPKPDELKTSLEKAKPK